MLEGIGLQAPFVDVRLKDQERFRSAVAAIDWNQETSAHGPPEAIPLFLKHLWVGTPLDVEDDWLGVALSQLWHQGSVFGTAPAKVVEPLLLAAESDTCRWRSVAAGTLAFIADGKGESSVEHAIREMLLARQERFTRLAARADLVGRAAQWICLILQGQPKLSEESGLYEIGSAVERELDTAVRTDEEAEAATERRQLRADPSPLIKLLETMQVGGRMEEANARSLIRKASEVGLFEAALKACDRLSYDAAQQDELRVQLLLASGARETAREAVLGLARDWLTPASRPTSANQVIPKRDLVDLLRRVTLPNDPDLHRLLAEVEDHEPGVFMGDGDVF